MVMPESWSSDGSLIFYSVFNKNTGYDMWALPLFGDRKPFPVLRSEHWESQAQLSPNGRLLSYTSNDTGQLQVYVTNFPSREGTRQISTSGGGDARWRRDGRELFYIAPNETLMAVPVTGALPAGLGSPVPLFKTSLAPVRTISRQQYVVARDGQRFLMVTREGEPRPITLILNWRPPQAQ